LSELLLTEIWKICRIYGDLIIMRIKDNLFQSIDLCLEVCDRYIYVVENITSDQFVEQTSDLATIGEHVRHFIDFQTCFLGQFEKGTVNYDKRERNSDFSESPKKALHALNVVKMKLKKFYGYAQNKKVTIQISISSEGSQSEAQSTLERELVFIADHGVHHLASVNIIGKFVGFEMPREFTQHFSTLIHKNSITEAPELTH